VVSGGEHCDLALAVEGWRRKEEEDEEEEAGQLT
jgi:hypothetical protein